MKDETNQFDAQEYLDSLNIEPEEIVEKKINPMSFSIDVLMREPVNSLFIRARIETYFDKGIYSVHWVNMLKKEITRLNKLKFSDETFRTHQKRLIENKILEIKNYDTFNAGANNHSPHAETVANVGTGSQTKKPIKEKELKQWLRETWISEGRLGGTAFFTSLKKYVNTKGSPILEHYTAGKCAGFRWETSTTTRGEMRKKTILNIVATFKNTP